MTPENAAAADGALIGHCIDERYRLEAVIGVGGLGSVYRATHTKLQRPVAVKLLHESFGQSQVQRGRFAREAKALAALQHPNIVAVLDYGVSEARPYLVMELLEGETLSQRLQEGPLGIEPALQIAAQLLEALSFMHRARLVHRDVKPSNVFLQRLRDGHDRAKVLDFGLAKFTAPALVTSDPTLTRDGAILGTPAYMSPEQATGEIVDARSDVYAAGVILFRMLAGRLPFEGDAIEQVRSHLISPVPSLNRAQPDAELDPKLEALIKRAMAKRREDRFEDAGQMLRALIDDFPQFVRAALPEHEPVLPDPFAIDALNADWLLSKTDASSEVPTLPRDPRSSVPPSPSSPARSSRPSIEITRGSVQKVGRAMRTVAVTGFRLFAGVSVLLVVGAGIIIVLLWRSEDDRAELTAFQRRVSDRLIERSIRGGQPPGKSSVATEVKPSKPGAPTAVAPVVPPPAASPPAETQGAAPAAVPLVEPAAPAQPASDVVAQVVAASPPEPGPVQHAALTVTPEATVAKDALAPPAVPPQPPAAASPEVAEAAPKDQLAPPAPASTAPVPAAAPPAVAVAPVAPAAVETSVSAAALAEGAEAAPPQAPPSSRLAAALERAGSSAAVPAALVPQSSAAIRPGALSMSAQPLAAIDPWQSPIPQRLKVARKVALANGRGSEALVLALRDYNREQREDPRGHLLLGQLYMNRYWRSDALSQFSIALTLDPSVRGAPEVLPSLLALVIHGSVANEAQRQITTRYGAEALPGIERALSSVKDPKATARLRLLRARVTSERAPITAAR